jgi:endonuclease-3 related protein
MTVSEQLTEIYQLLLERFGPQHWWPGETQLEIITGAILTQNTNWTNVEKAIKNLKLASLGGEADGSAGLLTAQKLYAVDLDELAELIRPAGYYNIKAKRVKSFLKWLFEDFGGQLANVEGVETDRLREQLLSIKGVGRETADSILLYAFKRCVFVVDAYTARVAVRHGLIEGGADYEQLREVFQSNLRQDERLFNEYHALLVRVGKEFCRPKARCAGCPLEALPHNPENEY